MFLKSNILNRVTASDVERILSEYKSGKTASAVASAVGVDLSTVYYWIQKHGISRKPWSYPRQRKLPPAHRKEIALLYQAGSNSPEIARRFKVSPTTIIRHLHKQGINPRDGKKQRKYTLDETAFDSISEHSAYWAGFLMADGCIYHKPFDTKPRVLSLGLNADDASHVRRFAEFLKTDRPLWFTKAKRPIIAGRVSQSRPSCHFQIYSERLCAALGRFGLRPRKSLNAKVRILQNNRHFWRGVIDGDGTVSFSSHACNSFYRPTGKIPYVSLVGSFSMVQQFANFVSRNISGVPLKVARPDRVGSKIAKVGYAGRLAVQIAQLLYRDSQISLDRKSKNAQQIISLPLHRDRCKRGHLLTPENTKMRGHYRKCRACLNLKRRQLRASRRITQL